MLNTGTIRIGVGGWTYQPWRGTFYPEGLPHARELPYAAGVLTALEINGTFYRTQKPETFAKWRDSTPPGFVFTVKAPRYTTNRKVLAEAGDSIDRFLTGGVAELGDKLGPILWQFPETKRFEPDDVAAFLPLLTTSVGGRPLRHAVELRHESFRTPEMIELARAHRVAIVWAVDSRHPDIAEQTADFAYVRLLGTQESEPLGYSPEALDRRAKDVLALARGSAPGTPASPAAARGAARDVFCFVIGGHKVRNPAAAKALIERLGRAGTEEGSRGIDPPAQKR